MNKTLLILLFTSAFSSSIYAEDSIKNMLKEKMTLRLENCNLAKKIVFNDAIEYARSKKDSTLKNLKDALELMKSQCIHAGIAAEKADAVDQLHLED